MKKFNKSLVITLILSLCISLTAPVDAKSKIRLNRTKATLSIGGSINLKLLHNKKKVTWKSSNKKIASVTKKGKVKAKKKGTAKITAKVGKKKYTCKITVDTKKSAKKASAQPSNKKIVTPTPAPNTTNNQSNTPISTPTPTPEDFGEIELNMGNECSLYLGRSKSIQVVSGFNKENLLQNDFAKWSWINHNEDIVSIERSSDSYNIPHISIKAIKIGTATISITNGIHTTECKIHVVEMYAEFEFNEDKTEIIGCNNAKTATIVDIPDGVKKVSCDFSKNNYLHTVTMADSVEEISTGDYYGSIFCDCKKLKSITLSKSLKKLERVEFRGCIIESIYIPPSIEKIWDGAFDECDNLKTIYGESGSYAETWAESKGFEFIAQ